MTQGTEADRKVTAAILGYASWADATDYRLCGDDVKERDEVLSIIARHREQAVQEAVAERDARIEGLTVERDFHRETADLHAARIAELHEALSAVCRLLGPVGMTLAQQECIDEPLPREAVILSFMGSGASDRVTVGEYQDAMALARAALKEIDNG